MNSAAVPAVSSSGSATRLGRQALAWGRLLLGPIVVVVVASFVISAALSLAPGNPAAELAGAHATPHRIAVITNELGLDDSLFARYGSWVSGVFHGDLGRSISHHASVVSLVGPRLLDTLYLIVYASILVLVFGIGIGILGGAFRWAGPLVAGVSSLGVAIPAFVSAQLLTTVFALDLGWFPATGNGTGFGNRIWHLTLPAIALSIGWGAYVAQITRTAITEEYDSEHVETAIGRGLLRRTVFRRHVLRNAAGPIVTITGLSMAGLIAGTVVVESAFGLNGIGSLLVDSVSSKDYNVVEAITILFVVVFVVVTTGIDAIGVRLDPRLWRRSARR